MSFGKVFFTAYFWNMLGKLVFRALGLVSTLIIVRLLAPEDFGLVAIGIMVIGLFEVLSNCGVNRYLILHEAPTNETYDSVWTLNIILRVTAVIFVISVSPLIASYLGNSKLQGLLIILALLQVVTAFNNIGLVKLEKEVNFAPVNKILIFSKLFSVITTITTAWYFRNYYALVAGNTVLGVLTLLGSYIVSSYRPKFNFRFESAMFKFSTLILLRNVVSYSRSQIDVLIVGKLFGENITGKFSVAKQFATLPHTELILPAMQPIFSMVSQLKNSKTEFDQKIYQALFYFYVLILPSAFGLYFLAGPFVDVVLGPQWTMTKEYIGLLGFFMLLFANHAVFQVAYDSRGKILKSMLSDLIAIALLLFYVLFEPPKDIHTFVDIRMLIAALCFVLAILFACYFTGLSYFMMLKVLLVPAVATLIMTFMLSRFYFSFETPLAELVINAAIGAVTYALSITLVVYLLHKLSKKSEIAQLLPLKVYLLLGKA